MGVTKWPRKRSTRKSVKARRPWSRTVATYRVPKPIRTYGRISSRDGVYGLGQSFRTKLKYVEAVVLQSVAGAVGRNVFSPQNMFDPNNTGTGHQPMFWDQFTPLYGKYKVHNANISVSFNVQTETAGTSVFAVGILGGSATTIAADPNTNMEDNHGTYTILNGRNGDSGQKTLTLDYAPWRDVGLSVGDDTLNTNTSAGPSSYFWNVWAADLNSVGTTNVMAVVTIIYDVEFSDNVNIAGS